MSRYALILAALIGGVATAQDMAPFVIPAAQNDKSLVALPDLPAVATDGPRVEARDGHFWLGAARYRVWGVNTAYAANFPTHEQAAQIAARLAAFGINNVRMHHMDNQPFPNGIWDPKDRMKFSEQSLDRLDYFIDQLACKGIRVNINLHVSRVHGKALKLPDADKLPEFDKVVDIFTPALIDAQKKYARDLLGHVNAYRKVRYADDPAVAFVEINNEDSMFMWGSAATLQTLPPYYAKILQDKFAAFLKGKYTSTDKLAAAWNKDAQPLGQNMLSDGGLRKVKRNANDPATWYVEEHEGAKINLKSLDNSGMRIEFATLVGPVWHVQLNWAGLGLKEGQHYTLSFRARSDKPRKITAAVSLDHEPWTGLGLQTAFELSSQWKTYTVGFTATASDEKCRAGFMLGGSDTAVEFDDVSLAPGGVAGLGKDETIEAGNVALFPESEGPVRQLDRMEFLAETEKAFFDDMYKLIKRDIGCKALVTGTIVFGPLGLYGQSGMDYIDGHAYWRHPEFPGRAWDRVNWLVGQQPMVDHMSQSPLFNLVAQRLVGKPYTVSEYNHPAPLDAQAETVPEIAAFAAAQDWDGVWMFDYNSRSNTDTTHFVNFFDIDAVPAKMGFMQTGALMFRDGLMGIANNTKVVPLASSADTMWADLAAGQMKRQHDMFGCVKDKVALTADGLLACRLSVSIDGKSDATLGGSRSAAMLTWTSDPKAGGKFLAESPFARVFVGHTQRDVKSGLVALEAPSLAAITVTSMDGAPLAKSAKILITACGRCENTGMVFTADRRSVGANWGKAPVLIEPVDASVPLPAKANWKVQPLNPDGTPSGQFTITDDTAALKLDAKYKTMWYLLTRE